jgi:hypothetical protein
MARMSRSPASWTQTLVMLTLSFALGWLWRNPSRSPPRDELFTAQPTATPGSSPSHDSLVKGTSSARDSIVGMLTAEIGAAVLVAVVAILITFFLYPATLAFLRRHLTMLLLVLIVAWFVGGYYIVRGAALEAASYIRRGQGPAVEFQFKTNGTLAAANVTDANNARHCPDRGPEHINRICRANLEDRFFLIMETGTHFVVFFKAEPIPGIEVEPRGFVYHIPVEEVATAVVSPPVSGSSAAMKRRATQ